MILSRQYGNPSHLLVRCPADVLEISCGTLSACLCGEELREKWHLPREHDSQTQLICLRGQG